jgi:hypothetical protein
MLAAMGSVMRQNRRAEEVYRAASVVEGQRCTGMGRGSEHDTSGKSQIAMGCPIDLHRHP